jgi:hypothetical protein
MGDLPVPEDYINVPRAHLSLDNDDDDDDGGLLLPPATIGTARQNSDEYENARQVAELTLSQNMRLACDQGLSKYNSPPTLKASSGLFRRSAARPYSTEDRKRRFAWFNAKQEEAERIGPQASKYAKRTDFANSRKRVNGKFVKKGHEPAPIPVQVKVEEPVVPRSRKRGRRGSSKRSAYSAT